MILIIALLTIANMLGFISKHFFNHPNVYGIIPLFDLNAESNIPTLYSSFALLLVCLLLFLISIIHKNMNSPYLHWFVLAIIFLFLSIDEIAFLHERLEKPVYKLLTTFGMLQNVQGLLFFAWVIPYGIFLIIFVISYIKFLNNLPREISKLFIISGTIFIIAAIGFEMIEGMFYDINVVNNITYDILCIIEEILEMVSIAIFIYALLLYLKIKFNFQKITLTK